MAPRTVDLTMTRTVLPVARGLVGLTGKRARMTHPQRVALMAFAWRAQMNFTDRMHWLAIVQLMTEAPSLPCLLATEDIMKLAGKTKLKPHKTVNWLKNSGWLFVDWQANNTFICSPGPMILRAFTHLPQRSAA